VVVGIAPDPFHARFDVFLEDEPLSGGVYAEGAADGMDGSCGDGELDGDARVLCVHGKHPMSDIFWCDRALPYKP
jgi:hypothetical protein